MGNPEPETGKEQTLQASSGRLACEPGCELEDKQVGTRESCDEICSSEVIIRAHQSESKDGEEDLSGKKKDQRKGRKWPYGM